jgi:Mor family transcriptional regulator
MGLSQKEIQVRNIQILQDYKNNVKVTEIARRNHLTRARVYQIIYAATT